MTVLADLADFLVRGRNADGGWGYYRGKSTRLEPTAWATLALHQNGAGADAGEILRRWPSRNGILLEQPGGQPNYAFQGLALVVLHACGLEHAAGNRALLAGLQQVKGIALPPSNRNRQNNALQGWSWTEGAFSWVEPTGWCLFALKKWARSHGESVDVRRLDEAERLLIDRSCVGGGWNYGNSNMLGQELKAYVPTTALALLAMQDRRSHPLIQRSLQYLENAASSERSGMALALALLALEAYGRMADPVRAVLNEQLPVTLELGNHAAIAHALFALSDTDDHAAFRL